MGRVESTVVNATRYGACSRFVFSTHYNVIAEVKREEINKSFIKTLQVGCQIKLLQGLFIVESITLLSETLESEATLQVKLSTSKYDKCESIPSEWEN